MYPSIGSGLISLAALAALTAALPVSPESGHLEKRVPHYAYDYSAGPSGANPIPHWWAISCTEGAMTSTFFENSCAPSAGGSCNPDNGAYLASSVVVPGGLGNQPTVPEANKDRCVKQCICVLDQNTDASSGVPPGG